MRIARSIVGVLLISFFSLSGTFHPIAKADTLELQFTPADFNSARIAPSLGLSIGAGSGSGIIGNSIVIGQVVNQLPLCGENLPTSECLPTPSRPNPPARFTYLWAGRADLGFDSNVLGQVNSVSFTLTTGIAQIYRRSIGATVFYVSDVASGYTSISIPMSGPGSRSVSLNAPIGASVVSVDVLLETIGNSRPTGIFSLSNITVTVGPNPLDLQIPTGGLMLASKGPSGDGPLPIDNDGVSIVKPNEAFSVTVPVSLSGMRSGDTRNTTVTLKAGNQALQTKTVSLEDIHSGKASSVNFEVSFGPEDAGLQKITATIDPENALREANFSNNTASTEVRVEDSLIFRSLLASNISVDPQGNVSGDLGLSYTWDGYPVNTSVPFCVACGQPVNLATGLMWHPMMDFSVSGRTPVTGLKLARTYLSQPVFKGGDFGPNWFNNWETRILPLSSGSAANLAWMDETGGLWIFKRNVDGSLQSPAGFFGTLTEFPDYYELKKPHAIIYRFNKDLTQSKAFGKLVSITESHGESISLSYDTTGNLLSISTGLAGTVSFHRDSLGRVTQVIRERDGLSYSYAYDSNGRLASSSDFDGNTSSYIYVSAPGNPAVNGRLSTLTDPLGRQLSFTYQQDGRALSQTEFGNATRSFQYGSDAGNPATWVSEIDGSVTEFQFDGNFRLIKTIRPDSAISVAAWNSQNLLSSITDALGYVTRFGYDTHGNLSSIQRPEDSISTQVTYDLTFDAPTLITPLAGAPTQLELSPATGDVTRVTRSDHQNTLSLAFTYDAFGQQLSVNNGRATYSDQTDPDGLKTLVFDARNPESRAYDTHGRVTSRTFKNGRIIHYSYDTHDRVLEITDSNGPSLSMTYDIVGRLLTKSVSDGHQTQTTQYQWDVRDRLVSVTDALGNKTERQFDPSSPNGVIHVLDQPIALIDALGHKTQLEYDTRQRLIQQTDANGSVIKYQYNLRGDLIALIDPNGNKTSYEVDGNHRVTARLRASVLTNAQGKTVTAPELTRYYYDKAGKLVREQKVSASGDGIGVTELTYDAWDRLIRKAQKRLDSKNTIQVQDDSAYSYEPELDATLLSSASNGVEKLSFQHEPVAPFAVTSFSAQATVAKNPLGLVEGQWSVQRDITGEISSITDIGAHTLWSASYDSAGRLTSITSGNLFESKKSSSPRPLMSYFNGESASPIALSSHIFYDGFGRKNSLQHSSGLSGQWTYDALNRPTSIRWDQSVPGMLQKLFGKSALLSSEALSYDRVGDIIGAQKPFGAITYSYDPASQLTHVSVEEDLRLSPGMEWKFHFNRSFGYDPNGNRIQDSLRGPATYLNDQILSANGGHVFQSDPDGFGNLTAELDLRTGLKKTYAYRLDGKLLTYSRSQNHEADHDREWDPWDHNPISVRYDYDALGRRVAKEITMHPGQGGSFTQTYAYLADQDKILLGKNGKGAQTLHLDGPGIDEHLGQVNAQGALGYATDHLGSVLNTAPAGLLHAYGSFGESIGIHVNGLSSSSDPVTYGYTGRQWDPESGQYYYRARIYNQTLGRFISKDPIGFGGGQTNLYGYVMNDPINWIDPEGLAQKPSENGGGSGAGGFEPVEPIVEVPLVPKRFTPDQSALIDLAKQSLRKGVNPDQAKILEQWSKELNIEFRGPEAHPNRPFGQYPHLHIGPIDHIPVNQCKP